MFTCVGARAQVADSTAFTADSTAVPVDTTVLPMATGYDWITYRGKADITDTGGTRTCNFYMVNRTDSILYQTDAAVLLRHLFPNQQIFVVCR